MRYPPPPHVGLFHALTPQAKAHIALCAALNRIPFDDTKPEDLGVRMRGLPTPGDPFDDDHSQWVHDDGTPLPALCAMVRRARSAPHKQGRAWLMDTVGPSP